MRLCVSSLPLVLALSIFFNASAAAAQTYQRAQVHPWDYPKRLEGHRNTWVDYAELEDFYYNNPQRSVTHALHPFHRRRYYNPRPYLVLNSLVEYGEFGLTDIYELDGVTNRWSRSDDREGSTPLRNGRCRNYTFSRPNYRVAPFRFRCVEE